jgi:hypothetical protein
MTHLSTVAGTLGNAGAVANARRGAEVQQRHDLVALELQVRLEARDRALAQAARTTWSTIP